METRLNYGSFLKVKGDFPFLDVQGGGGSFAPNDTPHTTPLHTSLAKSFEIHEKWAGKSIPSVNRKSIRCGFTTVRKLSGTEN